MTSLCRLETLHNKHPIKERSVLERKGMSRCFIIFITAFIPAFWDPKSLIQFIQGVLSIGLKVTSVNLTIHVQPVPKLRIRGATVPFPINIGVPWINFGIIYFIHLVPNYIVNPADRSRYVVVVVDQGPEPRLRLHCSHWAYCTSCFLEVPTVATRCLHVLRDARDPSSERWNFNGRERVAENFDQMPTST
jgi:hypothetical protein